MLVLLLDERNMLALALDERSMLVVGLFLSVWAFLLVFD